MKSIYLQHRPRPSFYQQYFQQLIGNDMSKEEARVNSPCLSAEYHPSSRKTPYACRGALLSAVVPNSPIIVAHLTNKDNRYLRIISNDYVDTYNLIANTFQWLQFIAL